MSECSKECGSCESAGNCDLKLQQSMAKIDKKIMVLSGKGGVGKSSVSVNLALSLAMKGYRVGLLDIDFHGPSIPTMLGLQNDKLECTATNILPAEAFNIKVVSIAMLLEQQNTDAVIWRGPMKSGVLKQLLEEVEWGNLDYLIMDFPPGTGDEALSACQLISDATGAIIVTTPQEVSLADCRRSISFCQQLNLPILGVIENMSGFSCPDCGKIVDIFGTDGGKNMAEQFNIPFLGKLPIDPAFAQACDNGVPFLYAKEQSVTAKEFEQAISQLI
ncbi:Mrp/NBP35 family ATP-binding protein [Lentisphaerota bacterium WC36G]|nr:Mrp/NBP35 family ATP-binding protein [Lentisphaerae bacterium WC36]